MTVDRLIPLGRFSSDRRHWRGRELSGERSRGHDHRADAPRRRRGPYWFRRGSAARGAEKNGGSQSRRLALTATARLLGVLRHASARTATKKEQPSQQERVNRRQFATNVGALLGYWPSRSRRWPRRRHQPAISHLKALPPVRGTTLRWRSFVNGTRSGSSSASRCPEIRGPAACCHAKTSS